MHFPQCSAAQQAFLERAILPHVAERAVQMNGDVTLFAGRVVCRGVDPHAVGGLGAEREVGRRL